MLKFINLISGSGSTNLAVLEAEKPGGRLFGLTKTVAIISSNPKARGIEKAKRVGFPEKDIHLVFPEKGNLAKQILEIFDKYKPDYFHQLGWLPMTPIEVLKHYKGLNQHLGPGGKWLYGIRRIYAFIVFCQRIGELRPLSIFCQFVAPEYDKGNVIYVRYEEIEPGESPEEAAERLLAVEHQVQIEGRYVLARGIFKEEPVPKVAKDPREEKILFEAMKKARNKYPGVNHRGH
jgi:folate-dependent phosphoribosylglycinamide formyltransferase PurN